MMKRLQDVVDNLQDYSFLFNIAGWLQIPGILHGAWMVCHIAAKCFKFG